MPFQFRKEAIEEDLNSNFPSQGQGNPPLYYSLSEVVVPTYSINSVAEGSGLPENLQTAWDFSTGSNQLANSSATIVSNTGFWQIDLTATNGAGTSVTSTIALSDGLSSKNVWVFTTSSVSADSQSVTDNSFVVFLRSGDTLTATAGNGHQLNVWYRQIATVNGQLVNPLGFSFA